jgi:hypothetical protein
MWNEQLAAQATAYTSAVLTALEPSGYPASVRCVPLFDAARQVITIPVPPPGVVGWSGPAALLFHRHSDTLEDQHELMIKGDLLTEDGVLTLRPADFLTGTGSPKTDRMPHAGAPLDLIQFMLLGQRKAREYLAKRGKPWPPVPFKDLIRYLKEH